MIKQMEYSGFKHHQSQQQLPQQFLCPISQRIMIDPVLTKDGVSFQRSQITKWIEKNHNDPFSRQNLQIKDLKPNRALRDTIQNYLKKLPNLKRERLEFAEMRNLIVAFQIREHQIEKIGYKTSTGQQDIQKYKQQTKKLHNQLLKTQKQLLNSRYKQDLIFQKLNLEVNNNLKTLQKLKESQKKVLAHQIQIGNLNLVCSWKDQTVKKKEQNIKKLLFQIEIKQQKIMQNDEQLKIKDTENQQLREKIQYLQKKLRKLELNEMKQAISTEKKQEQYILKKQNFLLSQQQIKQSPQKRISKIHQPQYQKQKPLSLYPHNIQQLLQKAQRVKATPNTSSQRFKLKSYTTDEKNPNICKGYYGCIFSKQQLPFYLSQNFYFKIKIHHLSSNNYLNNNISIGISFPDDINSNFDKHNRIAFDLSDKQLFYLNKTINYKKDFSQNFQIQKLPSQIIVFINFLDNSISWIINQKVQLKVQLNMMMINDIIKQKKKKCYVWLWTFGISDNIIQFL